MTTLNETPTVPAVKSPKLTWHGISTVARLELMQRVRSSKWKMTLLLWFIGVGAVCVLIATAVQATETYSATPVGPYIFGANVYFILFMGLLITPTLSSTAINGDREKGTLAILQASLLTPLEITLGKLAASWVASMAFLIVSLPFILWAFAAGGVTIGAVVSSIVMMAFLLLVVCAVSLYLSARSNKPAGSTVTAYGFVAFICLISLLIWGLLLSTVTGSRTVTGYEGAEFDSVTGHPTACVAYTREINTTAESKLWPLLALNPFVLVADITTPNLTELDSRSDDDSFMRGIASSVRSTRIDSNNYYNDGACTSDGKLRSVKEQEDFYAITQVGNPVWPYGVAFHLIVGALAVWRTSRRLTTPYATLPKGTRIA